MNPLSLTPQSLSLAELRIGNIWAAGRNYAAHATELGNSLPESPLIFLKAGSCATFASEITLPQWTKEVHHELELALLFGNNLEIQGAALALDLTERTEQSRAKKNGLPWTLAKSFSNACPLSTFVAISNIKELSELDLKLEVNGLTRQAGNTKNMIFTPEALVEFICHHFPVRPGDLLLTGTPEGVGPIHRGDTLRGQLGNLIEYQWKFR